MPTDPSATLQTLIEQSIPELIENAERCLERVEQANETYRSLDRPATGADKVVDLKLRTILWRHALLRQLLGRLRQHSFESRLLLEILLALNTHLKPDQQQRAAELLAPDEFATLQAAMGINPSAYPGFAARAGPGIDLNIVANRSSRWSFEKWRRNERFSRYEMTAEGVRYRGVEFTPGDVLLANVNLDGNGVYTTLSDPKSFSSHSAFFAVLKHDGRRFPVVVETYEKGLRPVPLSVFLGPRFCSYVEVYRHREYSDGHAAAVNEAAARFIDEVRGYNFNSEDVNPAYMSCTAVGRFLHQAAGMTPILTVSRLAHPNIQSNLSKLGYTWFDFFAPVDFLLSDRFRYIGRIDNNQPERLLARELVDREFRRQFEARDLHPGKFPLMGAVNRWGIGQIRRGNPVGWIIGKFEGFDADNLPKGPDQLMSVITLAEKQIGAVIKKTTNAFARELENSAQPDLDDLLGNARINALVSDSLDLPWLPPAEKGVGDK